MALPIIKIASDCADYANSLRPYFYQLRPLPALVWEHLTNSTALKQLYIDTNPFISGLAFSLFLSPIFLLASEVNQNWSQIDRVWSILPTLYNAHWAIWSHMAGIHTQRMDLRLLVSMVWSTRLTYNYWRRGGYKIGSEDYRWTIIKDKIGQPAFFILDVLFIAGGQNILLFLVTCPSYIAVLLSRLDTANNTPAAGLVDYWFTGQILFLIGLTWLSDQQQWGYQSAKNSYRNTAKVPANCGFTAEQLDRGFRTTGLWAYSRHPNFACEQMVWWSFYLWASLAARSPFNWTIIGPLIYTSVFLGSTPITEYISKGKYPEYKEYQEQVGMFLPKSSSKPKFSGKSSPQRKRITTDGVDASAKEQNAADYAQAKQRYDLR